LARAIRSRRRSPSAGRLLRGWLWYLLVSLPVYVLLFYVVAPKVARRVALGPDPYGGFWWWLVRERARSLNAKRHGTITCTECGRQDRRVDYHCHHIQYRAHRPDLFLSISNLAIVCEPCHWEIHENDGA